MKKALLTLLTTFTVMTVLIACQPKDDGGGGFVATDTYAGTPTQDCNIPGNPGCNPNMYQQYAPEFTSYQWSNTNGFCGCPMGYRPVMNTQWGISCAPDTWFPTYQYYGYNYNTVVYQSQNGQWTNIPQVTYSPATSGYGGGNCYATAASVCDTRSPVSQCGAGGFCRASGGGSHLGLCTYGTGNESYGNVNGSQCLRYVGNYYYFNVCTNQYVYGNYGGHGQNPGATGQLPR